ncbi:CheB methylesterase domain-containing protein [Helicobacter sp. 11S02629-2]|uniref:CheB methylesterase domain-containing protein n=1 Tax=Helicobacter sp. 11S02629-2 TaxID=1476195 RepID=UPI000BA69CEB|nr:CheB methylesterase domain-containing protein [Helicobacter sp. 11S02629-2]PAF45268.1 chemotaxis protein CheB [Helicobacter sp. 11S02629-2]
MKNKTPYLVEEKHHPDTVLPSKPAIAPKDKLIVIGSSTGGTEALNSIFSKLPRGLPPIVVVQHIPKTFSASLVQRLNANSEMDVYEVTEKMVLQPSSVYVASGDCHVLIGIEAGKYIVKPFDERRISRHKPSVDILFRSANNVSGANTLAIILTGMGDDGSIGMKELFDNGAYTIAQDEKSCVVFGMPKKAIEAGAVREILPLDKIPARIVALSSKKTFALQKGQDD